MLAEPPDEDTPVTVLFEPPSIGVKVQTAKNPHGRKSRNNLYNNDGGC